jgi:hypothetical protein
MKDQFVPHEIAILLKEKGFTDECMASYQISLTAQENEEDGFSGPFGWEKGEVNFNKGYFANGVPYCDFSNEHWLYCAAPLWQQVIDWFLEEHKLLITITSCSQESWQFHIQRPGDNLNTMWKEDFYSYNEARKTAIEHTLTLI